MQKHAKRIAVFGRSGSGKSTYVKKHLKRKSRVIVFDPLDEYGQEGFLYTKTLEEVRSIMQKRKTYKIAFVPPVGDEVYALHGLSNLLCLAQRSYKTGKSKAMLCLVVEEMNLSYPVTPLPADKRGFLNICSRGRHYGIELIGISQRVSEINKNFTGNTNKTIIFPVRGGRDLDVVCNEIGRDKKEILMRLPNFCFFEVEQDGSFKKKKL